jgi:hypothetical protein
LHLQVRSPGICRRRGDYDAALDFQAPAQIGVGEQISNRRRRGD